VPGGSFLPSGLTGKSKWAGSCRAFILLFSFIQETGCANEPTLQFILSHSGRLGQAIKR